MGKKETKTKTKAKTPSQPVKDIEKRKALADHMGSIILAVGAIIAAYLAYSATIQGTKIPIEATQTAESRLTAIAISTQTAETFYSSVAATQTTDALVTSFATTQTASLLETFIAATQTIEAVETETSIAMTKNAEAVETSIAMTQTAETSRTAIAMTNQAAKLPVNTPLPPSSYGGLTYGCVPVMYWLVDAKTENGNCWDLNKWGLNSDTQLFRIDVDNSNVIEKTISMNISEFKNADISFRLVVKDMHGNPEKTTLRLAVGICEPSRPQFEHAFVYYDLYESKLASAVTINGFNNKDKYTFYNNDTRNYRLEVRSYDLSIYENSTLFNSSTTIKRTDNTSFCLYYLLPEGGSLHAVIDKIFIERK